MQSLFNESMIKKANNLLGLTLSRLSVVAVVIMAFCTNAYADNKVSVESLSIKPGETKTVAVNLDNSDNISALQMDITLPYGLVYEESSLSRNDARLDRETHAVYMQALAGGANKYRLLIVPSGRDNIMGNSGAVVYFNVSATEGFTQPETIAITNILGSNTEKDEETGLAKKFVMDDCSVSVNPYVGRLYFSADTVAIKTDGTEKKLSVALDNYVEVRGMQADITLPAGLEIVNKENGKPKFDYGERLPQNAMISSNVMSDGRLRVIISGVTDDIFGGETGEVFSFYVKATDGLQLKSEVAVSGVTVSDNSAVSHSFVVDDVRNIEVTNSFLAHYTPANDSVKALREMYDKALKTIEQEYADVKDNEEIVNAQTALAAMLDELQKAVDEAYANETLAPEYDKVMSPAAEIIAGIEKLLADAKAAHDAKAANEEAYNRLTAEIAALQATFDEAKDKVAADCKDVADQFADEEAEIQEMIDNLTKTVNEQYEATELTEESTVDTSDIEAAIEKLVADAIEAQEKFTSGISSVTDNGSAEAESICTASGNRVQTLVRGQINIVKYSDGTVKKYYVK